MMFKGKKIFNASFDVYANNYHSVRPGYPSEMYGDISDHSKLDSNSRLLEIGAGSGIATAELAKFGCEIVGIEPGANLAEIAKKETAEFKNVKIIEGMFEDFESVEKFDTILALTSFHWINENVRYQKVVDLLRRDGKLVLVWNSFFQNDSLATAEVNSAYHELLPDIYPEESIVANVNESVLSKLNRREQEVISSPIFCSIFLRKYLITYNYDYQTYPKLLNTFPKIVEIEEGRRLKFLGHISEVVKKYGKISVPILTTMIICRRRSYFLESVANSEGGL